MTALDAPDRAATGAEPAIERLATRDEGAVRDLLAAAALPLDGLELALGSAVVARSDGGLVGCAAFEPYADSALLRSVCVAPDWRSRGLGRRLVEAVLDLARAQGIRDVYLLTETAATWFPGLGFEPIDRKVVPPLVAASPEFAHACPVSAAAFHRRI